MKTLNEAIEQNLNGLHFGGRILLPFCVHIFNSVIVKKAIMEDGKDLEYIANFSYRINDDFTEVCFSDYEELYEHLSEEDCIKLLVAEKGKDVFNESNRVIIKLHLKDDNKVNIVLSE